jgi:hypothetical protein
MANPARASHLVVACRLLLHAVIIVLLTVLTQIGGLVWLLALALRHVIPWRSRAVFPLLFIALYSVATFVTLLVAPLVGRVALPCFPASDATLAVRSALLCALNRNYVVPEMAQAASAYADHIARVFPGTRTLALDANFPFVTGFPLIPHLSHDDGRKLDLALYYRDAAGDFRNGQTRSPLGYFAFQQPGAGAAQPCADRSRRLTLRWDLEWLQPVFPDWKIEPKRMREGLRWLSSEGARHGIGKVLVEPHISASLGVASSMIRFQGCRAARHDDHIHIELR